MTDKTVVIEHLITKDLVNFDDKKDTCRFGYDSDFVNFMIMESDDDLRVIRLAKLKEELNKLCKDVNIDKDNEFVLVTDFSCFKKMLKKEGITEEDIKDSR
ncbi:MAG: hypothetical protein KO202_06635 [Methanobacteriaceae archaeon]|jgi:hypothetical protein|nr:hypothetical protein [Methanobacteriaceae archaeon]